MTVGVFEAIDAGILERLYHKREEPVDAVPTMLPSWNHRCRDEGGGVGLARGWQVIVAGKTGAGKSLVGLNLAIYAMRKGEYVGYISLEMSQDQLITRAMAIYGRVAVRKLEPGKDYDYKLFQQVSQEWEDNIRNQLCVNQRPISKLQDVRDAMIHCHDIYGCRYFVTDYLQLAWVSGADTIYDQVTEVSHTIRATAHDLSVVSVGLSQFNRRTSASKDRPEETGLMGGSPLENDADQVLLLDHTTLERLSDVSTTQEILLKKNRHGAAGRIKICWDYDTLELSELDDMREGGAPF